MLTLYYLMKKAKKDSHLDIKKYYKNIIVNNKLSPSQNSQLKCRICLQDGITPIFDNGGSNTNIVEALQIFGDIKISEDDEYPKYLCKMCHKFITSAILFRKIAKQSDNILKQVVKEEILDDNTDLLGDQELSDSTEYESKNTDEKWTNEPEYPIKQEKNTKIKYKPKVTCNICNKIMNRSYYKEHMTMHDPDHQKYVCDVCGKSFRLRCAYYNHSLRHRNDFPYKCQFCPYRGRYAELLKTHMRTHSGDYRYMCTECPARFVFKSNLNTHMLKHKDPQFKCDTCKRAFHSKLMLQRHHEADHLGIKNHVCNFCGKAFGYRNAMMKHQIHVHKREKLLFGRMPSYLEAGHSIEDCAPDLGQ